MVDCLKRLVPSFQDSDKLRKYKRTIRLTPGDATVGDKWGVPWYDSDWVDRSVPDPEKARFVHAFFMPKEASGDGSSYVPIKRGEAVQYTLDQASALMIQGTSYPPPDFDRRLTLNNWQVKLAWCMIRAGGRVGALQANLQLAFMLLDNPLYADVPTKYRYAFLVLFFLSCLMWMGLGLKVALSYRDFIHPDSRTRRIITLLSSALLTMFEVSNDLVLGPIHLTPQEKGGLCADTSWIEGNRRWPVHTISHQSKEDHDFTERAGLSVCVPMFLLMDIGCTGLNLLLASLTGILNMTQVLQLSICFPFAIVKTVLFLKRWRLRNALLDIWVRTASDPLMPKPRRDNAMIKYVAEGGKWSPLIDALEQAGMAEAPAEQISEQFMKRRNSKVRKDRRGSMTSEGDTGSWQRSRSSLSEGTADPKANLREVRPDLRSSVRSSLDPALPPEVSGGPAACRGDLHRPQATCAGSPGPDPPPTMATVHAPCGEAPLLGVQGKASAKGIPCPVQLPPLDAPACKEIAIVAEAEPKLWCQGFLQVPGEVQEKDWELCNKMLHLNGMKGTRYSFADYYPGKLDGDIEITSMTLDEGSTECDIRETMPWF